jgi:hypothetical protein
MVSMSILHAACGKALREFGGYYCRPCAGTRVEAFGADQDQTSGLSEPGTLFAWLDFQMISAIPREEGVDLSSPSINSTGNVR